MPKKTTEKVWSKNTRIICGSILIIGVVALAVLLFLTGRLMGSVLESQGIEFEDLLSGEVPFEQLCTEDADCACINDESVFCDPEFGTWSCRLGTCEFEPNPQYGNYPGYP